MQVVQELKARKEALENLLLGGDRAAVTERVAKTLLSNSDGPFRATLQINTIFDKSDSELGLGPEDQSLLQIGIEGFGLDTTGQIGGQARFVFPIRVDAVAPTELKKGSEEAIINREVLAYSYLATQRPNVSTSMTFATPEMVSRYTSFSPGSNPVITVQSSKGEVESNALVLQSGNRFLAGCETIAEQNVNCLRVVKNHSYCWSFTLTLNRAPDGFGQIDAGLFRALPDGSVLPSRPLYGQTLSAEWARAEVLVPHEAQRVLERRLMQVTREYEAAASRAQTIGSTSTATASDRAYTPAASHRANISAGAGAGETRDVCMVASSATHT